MKEPIIVNDGSIDGVRTLVGVLCVVGTLPYLFMLFTGGTIPTNRTHPSFIFLAGIIGLFLLFWRSGAWIDREKRDLVTWSRRFGYYQETRTPLDWFQKVYLRTRMVRRNRRMRTVYTVGLSANPAVRGIRFSASTHFPGPSSREVGLYNYYDSFSGEKTGKWLADLLELPMDKRPFGGLL